MYPDLYFKPKLTPPTSYQGGKVRIAHDILRLIRIPKNHVFCDLCCGSGAVTLTLLNSGFKPTDILMVDSGPYGLFWESIANKTFDLHLFRNFIKSIPSDPKLICDHLKQLSSYPCPVADRVYVFLILQAGSFGGKSIGLKDGKWTNTSFRRYWEPKSGCNRKSHVNSMMPMPETLYKRVENIVNHCSGIEAYCSSIATVKLPSKAVLYIDPPYASTTGYPTRDEFNFIEYAKSVSYPVYISEAVPLSDRYVLISEGRTKGGISWKRDVMNNEYLSAFNIGV